MHYLFLNVEKLDSYLAGGDVKWYGTLENSIAHIKVKILTIWLSNHTLGHFSQRNENIYLHETLYMNVSSSFIGNGPKLEPARISFGCEQLHKLWCIHITPCYATIKKKEWTTQSHGSISRELSWEKRANPKSLCNTWFYLRNILEIIQL